MTKKISIGSWKVLLLCKKKGYTHEICRKESVSSRGLKRHETLTYTRKGNSKKQVKSRKLFDQSQKSVNLRVLLENLPKYVIKISV